MNPYSPAEVGRALFTEAADALFLLDPDTDVLLDVNPAAERLSGFTRTDLLAQPATAWFRFGGGGGAERLRDAATRSGTFHYQEGFFLRGAGEVPWVPVSVVVARLHVRPRTLALLTVRDAREQREMRARLRETGGELRRVMSAIPDCLWTAEVDAAGRWRYQSFSAAVLAITGHPAEALLGGPRHWRALVHAEDRPAWERVLTSLRSGKSSHFEYRLVRLDGDIRWVRESVTTTAKEGRRLRLDGVLTDVTEGKRAAEEHDLLFELSLDLLCIADFDGYFLRVSPAWERTLGWPAADLCAHPYLDFVHPDDREATVREASMLSGGMHTVSFENRYRCADGSYKWLQWNAAPLLSRRLVYAAARDVTERRRAQEELARAHEELKQAQSRLVQAEKLAALGQLIAGVAHEVNNPLSFVLNNVAVLRRDLTALAELLQFYKEAERTLAPEHPEPFAAARAHAEAVDAPYALDNLGRLLDRSEDGLRRIQRIVADLRDFARLDVRGLEQADLNADVATTLHIARGLAEQRGIVLTADLQPLPPVVCYPAKVNQVVLNLLTNAIDACPSGGTVTVATRSVPKGVEIHVTDTGSGVPPEIRDRIFDPFFTTKPPGQGTGLGLSISHGIVADHGGRIELDSPPGGGAHFTVYLPLRPPRSE